MPESDVKLPKWLVATVVTILVAMGASHIDNRIEIARLETRVDHDHDNTEKIIRIMVKSGIVGPDALD